MPVSDDEYVDIASDEEEDVSRPAGRQPERGRRVANDRQRPRKSSGPDFDLTRTWEQLTEGADGTITSAVEDLLEASKRKRLLKDTTPLQRGIIRHLILILDMSLAMNEKDLRPTRYFLMLHYTIAFIHEFFEQNPISQLGIIGMQNGMAVRISDMSGNPTEHLAAVHKMRTQEPQGHPSLQNALEMARGALFHAPRHGTREILLVMGSLHTSDPGDIHRTIDQLVVDKIRARVIGLAAQVAICQVLVSKTNDGDMTTTGGYYDVVLHEQHFRELMMEVTSPPVTLETTTKSTSTLLLMGFPSRTVDQHPSLCACHSRPSRDGYICPRCGTKVCSLPAECPTCDLTLILSTHLARSYHHLFPLLNWVEVPWNDAWRSTACFACQRPFANIPPRDKWETSTNSSRYECTVCHRHFCIDCDLFAHEVVHNCPGCQSVNLHTSLMGEEVEPPTNDVDAVNGHQKAVDDGPHRDVMQVDR